MASNERGQAFSGKLQCLLSRNTYFTYAKCLSSQIHQLYYLLTVKLSKVPVITATRLLAERNYILQFCLLLYLQLLFSKYDLSFKKVTLSPQWQRRDNWSTLNVYLNVSPWNLCGLLFFLVASQELLPSVPLHSLFSCHHLYLVHEVIES